MKIETTAWVVFDSRGWPVETIKGRPIVSLIRLLIYGRKIRKYKATVEVEGG